MKLKNGGNNGHNGSTAINGNTAVMGAPPSQVQKRMVLSAISKSQPSQSEKIVLYAPEGWGKTTWAAQAENPIFISTEDGLKNIEVDKFPEPQTWQDLFDAVDTLRIEDHAFKTLVIDTADWTEHLCQSFLLARDKKQSIEDYGYGKGYVVAFEEWKRLLCPIDALRREKTMSVIFLAHATIRTFNNPAGENYDRYEMKTDRRISALLKEWADCVLFGNYDVAVDLKKGQSKGKGYGGERVIYTNHSPAWDAKNRYGITEPIPADFASFWNAAKGGEVQ
jgi:hypothetical protein